MMKTFNIITSFVLAAVCIIAQTAFAQDNPTLEAISFKNATLDSAFSSEIFEYGLTLEDTSVTPTLESYAIKGDAQLNVTYIYDELNHQTGVTATLSFESGTAIYTFNFTNLPEYTITSNNNLKSLYCTYGEVYPSINEDDTRYNLYIPSDITELTITPVTQDINAYAAPITLTLGDTQTPEITINCVASNKESKEYNFKIKRLNKTVAQVREEMAQPGFTSFVDGTFLYQQPEFIIGFCSGLGGIIILFILFSFAKRKLVNPYDEDEKPFYSPIE